MPQSPEGSPTGKPQYSTKWCLRPDPHLSTVVSRCWEGSDGCGTERKTQGERASVTHRTTCSVSTQSPTHTPGRLVLNHPNRHRHLILINPRIPPNLNGLCYLLLSHCYPPLPATSRHSEHQSRWNSTVVGTPLQSEHIYPSLPPNDNIKEVDPALPIH